MYRSFWVGHVQVICNAGVVQSMGYTACRLQIATYFISIYTLNMLLRQVLHHLHHRDQKAAVVTTQVLASGVVLGGDGWWHVPVAVGDCALGA